MRGHSIGGLLVQKSEAMTRFDPSVFGCHPTTQIWQSNDMTMVWTRCLTYWHHIAYYYHQYSFARSMVIAQYEIEVSTMQMWLMRTLMCVAKIRIYLGLIPWHNFCIVHGHNHQVYLAKHHLSLVILLFSKH